MAGLSKVKGSGLATGAATASLVGIDDNATSTAITIDASENLTLAAGGTTYGKIGSSAGTYIASVACGLRLHSGGTKIFPTDANGGALPNAVDLGAGGGEWKDLYLSGNVKMASGKGIDFSATSDGSGSTGSEVLDDYEEGTWTPVLTGAGGGTHSGSGLYTKVGNIVHVSFKNENFSNTGFSGILTITGLPFAAISEQANVFGLTYNLSFTGYTSISAQTDGGGGVLRLVKSGSGLGYADLNATDLNATGNYHRSTLTYRIA